MPGLVSHTDFNSTILTMNETLKRNGLFNEFPPVSTKEWEDKIHEELKGADYNKKLVWLTPENFNVRPYYRKEDLSGKEYLETLPGEYPYLRGNEAGLNDWEIRQDILLDDIDVVNEKSLFVLERGITSLGFICPSDKVMTALKSQSDFSRLLKDIYFDCIGLYFVAGNKGPAIFELLKKSEANQIIASSEQLILIRWDTSPLKENLILPKPTILK